MEDKYSSATAKKQEESKSNAILGIFIWFLFRPLKMGRNFGSECFRFFFHAKSATTNNHVTGLSAGADLVISRGGGGGVSKFS